MIFRSTLSFQLYFKIWDVTWNLKNLIRARGRVENQQKVVVVKLYAAATCEPANLEISRRRTIEMEY